ncbi:MAG: 16S rRNA (guanine(527)-N(7))-methyltransferase RsmG [Acholeplasmataceae bacterium]|nr:16S rRNA (guanine(527)-N(7))-methyltransferase RsmG [Acholeplasmataceae bacterium]
MTFKEHVLQNFGIHLSSQQETQFEVYFNYLIEYNKITNLTRITDEREVYIKHFFDALTIIKILDFNAVHSLCDMGSGAGFPSIPLKIIFPHLDITIIDSLGKRIIFLENLINKLILTPINLINDRIETYAVKNQLKFDLVTARALGNMSLICEMGLPMTKVGGFFIAYKSINYEQELNQAKNAIKLLGGQIAKIETFELPNQMGHRTLISIQKTHTSQGFPRSFSQMIKKPL